MANPLRTLAISSVLALAGLLSGCGMQAPPAAEHAATDGVTGYVHGGQQPVSGATIQLYAVGTAASQGIAAPLLTKTVTTDAGGNFNITNLYSCANATQVYITATGGNPGIGANNPNLMMMTALGPCSSLNSGTYITVNELTTVAAAEAFAPAGFVSYNGTALSIGAATTAGASALAQAFALASEYVNPATGVSPGTNVPTGATVPTALLNTLADILSTCINSAGGTAGDSSNCGQLFALTHAPNQITPFDTFSAISNLASTPSLNTSSLFSLTGPLAPFQPQLSTVPSSFAVVLTSPNPSAALQFIPSSVTFPASTVGAVSGVQLVSLVNASTSTVTLPVNAASGNYVVGSFAGANAADFTTNNNCGTTLAPGGSCTLQIWATPGALGPRSASFIPTGYINTYTTTVSVSPLPVVATGSTTLSSAGALTLSANVLVYTVAYAFQDIAVTNYGNSSVPVSITVSDPTFVQTNNCGSSLPAQSVCVITVQSTGLSAITAGVYAPYNGTLTINEGAGIFQTVQLSSLNIPGMSGAGNISGANFGNITFGYYFPTTSGGYGGPTFENLISNITLGGANPGDFVLHNNGCYEIYNTIQGVLVANYTCYYSIAFAPQGNGLGVRTARLLYGYNQYTPVSGNGIPGTFYTLTGSSLNATVSLTSASATATPTITLANYGTVGINLPASAYAISGANASNFSLGPLTCGSIAPVTSTSTGGVCTQPFSFSATAPGTYVGNVTITDPVSKSFQTSSMVVTFTYTPFTLTSSTITFGIQSLGATSALQNLWVGEPYYHTVTFTLPVNTNFILPEGPSCTVNGSGSCWMPVEFSPNVSGPITETMTVTDTVTGQVSSVTLKGTGAATPPTLAPNPLTFPTRPVNTISLPLAVTLTNNASRSIAVSSVSLTGVTNGNFTQTNNCGATLAIGGSCTINVTFAPKVTGPQSATIQAVTDAQTAATTSTVTGTAQ